MNRKKGKSAPRQARAPTRRTKRSVGAQEERLPVPSDDLSPLARPMATTAFGLVVVTEVTGELVDPEEIAEYQPW